jgi:hypothetical protein
MPDSTCGDAAASPGGSAVPGPVAPADCEGGRRPVFWFWASLGAAFVAPPRRAVPPAQPAGPHRFTAA